MKTLIKELRLTLQSHETLNPHFWNGNKMKPEVWRALDKIGKEWADFANIPKSAIKDVILTGGNANYNYTKYSDLDLHLVVDKDKIDCQGLWTTISKVRSNSGATHDIRLKVSL